MLGLSLKSLHALTHQTLMNWGLGALRERGRQCPESLSSLLRPHSLQWFLPKTFMVELLSLNLLSRLIVISLNDFRYLPDLHFLPLCIMLIN